MDLLEHSFRTLIFYFYLVFMVRFLGKREVGQLGIFDFVVVMLVANIASISIEDLDMPFWYFIIIIGIIGLIQKIVSYLQLRISYLRNFFDGKPSIIIFNGNINLKEMKKNLYNIDDLLIQLRKEKISTILDVKLAILEHTGELSVYTYDDTKIIPLPVIVSGKIVKRNLFYLDLTIENVYKLLHEEKLELEDVNCAFYDNKRLLIIKSFKEFSVKNPK